MTATSRLTANEKRISLDHQQQLDMNIVSALKAKPDAPSKRHGPLIAIRPDEISRGVQNWSDDASLLICPLCGCGNIHHISTTFVRDGGDSYKAHSKVRGDTIVIPGFCEAGCRFNLFIGSHKGLLLAWGERRTEVLSADPTLGGWEDL